jgi:ABC-2 type transport system ATP-binding protein
MANIITVDNLVRNYGDFTAVDGISFQVAKGEIFGLLGPNGAGKTTTLEILETLREKTSGEVEIAGLSLDREPHRIKSIIGVQLQSAEFYEGLNLREIIRLFAGFYGAQVDPLALLEKVGLASKAKAFVPQLSGGQKQRFSIATTIIHNPQVIFLDEPSTGLDPQARRNVWDLILHLKGQGRTIVLTTHYMDEAEILCDRVGLMDNGRILKLDRPDSLINELLNKGFSKDVAVRQATLEDVFLDLTGKELRES